MKKQISTLTGFIIIAVEIIILFGGVFSYQYYLQKPILTLKGSNILNSSLTIQEIKNISYDISSSTYFGDFFGGGKYKSIKLINGVYNSGVEHVIYPSGCSVDTTHSVLIYKNNDNDPVVAFGDLNGDGKGDAAVMLSLIYKDYNHDGPHDYCKAAPNTSSSLMLKILLDKNNQPILADTYQNIKDVQNIKIENGIITLTGKTINHYKILGGKLVIINRPFEPKYVPSDWKTYANSDFGISFEYPPDIIVNGPVLQSSGYYNLKLNNNILISIGDSDFESCINFTGARDIPVEVIINQIPFYETGEGDCGMGTCSSTTQYSTVRNNKCYKLVLGYDTHNCSNYLPLEDGNTEQAKNYNNCLATNKATQGLSEILDQILSTFKFIK